MSEEVLEEAIFMLRWAEPQRHNDSWFVCVLASYPGSFLLCGWEKEPVEHCLCMCQIFTQAGCGCGACDAQC